MPPNNPFEPGRSARAIGEMGNMRKLVVGTFTTWTASCKHPGGLKYGDVEVGQETVITVTVG
jgi:hypothetical protein